MADKKASNTPAKSLQGSWIPSPSSSPPSSPSPPIDLSISDAERFKLLEDFGPQGVRPSELGLTNGLRQRSGAKGKGPMVLVSPEELEKMVEAQQRGAAPAQQEEVQEEEEPIELWEEIANALLWTVPFLFLFSGMDYAVYAQFGQRLVPREEITRVLNMAPAILLLNFLTLTRRLSIPPLLLQAALFILSVYSGLALIHTTTTAGYLQVMAQAPSLGTLWCWSVVRMDLVWAVLGLVGVAVGVTVRGEAGEMRLFG
ncbi:hypothetical protein JCM11641_006351 [Rhodosporidiobolus odoratus]